MIMKDKADGVRIYKIVIDSISIKAFTGVMYVPKDNDVCHVVG